MVRIISVIVKNPPDVNGRNRRSDKVVVDEVGGYRRDLI